jgi:hypothetical protein
MKKIIILLLGLVIGILISCKKNTDSPKIYTFKGKAQKGPLVTGANIILNELNSSLGQTGKSFTTSIVTDDGSFSLNNIELNSNLALLTANGFYFSEIYGELSSATLSLQAITNLTDKESVNINVLTHLIKGRIENLVASGKSFKEANTQAKSEFLSFLGVKDSFDKDFDNLDISANDDYNAVLLSFSIILQRYTMMWNERQSLTAELTQLLSNLSSDFASDGLISNRKLIDTLLFNISQSNLIDIRKNIEKRYSDLGQNVSIPNFEKYIAIFQQKYCSKLYTNFYYPDYASPDPIMAPGGIIPNLLASSNTEFQIYKAYSIAAFTPLNSALTIKFKGNNSSSNYILGGINYGWELISDYPNGFTLKSQRQNELMSFLINLEASGTAIIEYYENDTITPTNTKTIKWK